MFTSPSLNLYYLYNSLCIKLLELHRHKTGPSRTTNRCVEGQRYPIYNTINRGCKSCSRERRLGESASLELFITSGAQRYTQTHGFTGLISFKFHCRIQFLDTSHELRQFHELPLCVSKRRMCLGYKIVSELDPEFSYHNYE